MDDDSNTRIRPELSARAGAARSPALDIPASSRKPEAAEHVDRHEHEQAGVLESQLAYWMRKLQGASTSLQLPTDRPRRASQLYTTDRVQVKLPTALTKRLRNLSRQQHVSLYAMLVSGWAVLLGRWSGQEEVLIGARGLSRRRPELASARGVEDLVALRLTVAGTTTVEELLRQAEITLTDATEHSQVSLEQVVASLQPALSAPVLRVAMEIDDGIAHDEATTQFEVVLAINDVEGHLSATFAYASELFEPETIERMAASWKMLLHGMAKHVRRPLSQLGMLTAVEREQILRRFNETATPYPHHQLIHQLFEQQVERTPAAIAVEYGDQSLTYAELNGRANQLARYLRENAVSPGQLVGICIERSLGMIVGLLGILKAGAAYVPLDPSYPAERLAYMLGDAAPSVVLTHQHQNAALPVTSAKVIELDRQWHEIGAHARNNLEPDVQKLSAHNRVYVIYTSGSTGRPKGIEMPHRSMVNLIEWHRRSFAGNVGKRVLQFAALSFDVAFQETFTTFCTGGTLVLLDEWVRRDSRALMQLLISRSIQRIFVPPLVLQSLAELSNGAEVTASGLQDVITAGEQLRISAEVAKFFKRHQGCRLHNHYGPTETHVVTALTLADNPDEWPTLPSIGRPIANTRIYVLDAHLQPVPGGVSGEIYIGGASLADGYLNQPELTVQRFIADPFSNNPRGGLYKTGDLGRWRADGTLEYLGRCDDQVKIRGFRVELGEIEIQLARHADVKESAVVAREDVSGSKSLVAYVTLRDASAPRVEDLRAHLTALLPDYCIPSAIVILESLPVTPSGKLDRGRLPAPELTAYVSRPYEPPSGAVEQTLADIWRSLLRMERVGRQDNFFELGGDSLLMARMLELLRQKGLTVDVRAAFQSQTLVALARQLKREAPGQIEVPPNGIPAGCQAITTPMLPLVSLTAEQIELIARSVPGGAANIQDIYPLAPLQEGLLFHHLLNERSGDTYVLPTLLSVSTRQRLNELVAALQSVIARHDALRTAVLWEGLPQPLQVVYREAILPVEEVTLDPGSNPRDQVGEWMESGRQRLDLQRAPLMRLRVAEDPRNGQWYVLFQLHHIVGDNTTCAIIGSEVAAHLEGCAQRLPEPLPYRNHVAHLAARSSKRDAEKFFRSKLADIDEPSAPFGLLDVYRDGYRTEEACQSIDAALAHRVRAESRRLGTSPAVLFHAAWGLVVAHTSSREDVVFGSVLLGQLQSSSHSDRMLGMFINTLPLRIRLQNVTVRELVEQTQRELAELLAHEQASLSLAQRCSGIVDSQPLFTSLLNYRHGMPSQEAGWMSVNGISVLAHHDRTNYPLTVSIDDSKDQFSLVVQADRRIDPQRVLGYLQTALRSMMEALEQSPQIPALALSILPDSERHQIIASFNADERAYPQEKLLHELFEDQARRTPSATAVVYEEQRLTYSELNARADQLARYLRTRGVKPDQLVGICVERSLDMVVGLLGILKAGGAYVPLDPSYPAERLTYVLQDAAPAVLLIQGRLRARLPDTACAVIALDDDWSEIASASTGLADERNDDSRLRRLAYVIYTSGSTGKPKGVMIEHGNVTRLFAATAHWFGFNERDVWTLFHSFAFDFSVWELWGALLYGGRVVVVPSMTARSPEDLYRLLCDQGVTVLNQTPSAFAQLIDVQRYAVEKEKPPSLRAVIFGGEALELRTLRPWVSRNGAERPRLVNMYGITETTVHVTYRQLTQAEIESERGSVVGRPIPDLRIYILDRYGQPVPIGVVGEIHVAGAGLARGYLNRPELTRERFLPDPFKADAQSRMYKSGDLGRWRPDGTIEYLGRNDQQVKIRGYRIELGEIEAQLARHEHVKEVIVIAREDVHGDKRLVAYVILAKEASVNASAAALQAHLAAVLPEHMVPSAFVTLERFPLTANGKLDRRALPVPQLDAYVGRRYEAPEGETEEILASIWRELLRIEQVGRQDNFFKLGGDSLLAMQMAVRIRSCFATEMKMSALFELPMLTQLAAHLDELRQERLLNLIDDGGDDIDKLLERVSSMSESSVQTLMQQRRTGVSHD